MRKLVKVAIVGADATKWTEGKASIARGWLRSHFQDWSFASCDPHSGVEYVFLFGRSPKGGIDAWAETESRCYDFPEPICFSPEANYWAAYKKRNLKIAQECDILYCLAPAEELEFCYHCLEHGHVRNGGCWTMKKAQELGKEVHLIKI
jgi:hypothetical protein